MRLAHTSLLAGLAALACAPARAGMQPGPEPALVAEDDSAADREALEALAALEYRSLDRRADHVRGQFTAVPPVLDRETGGVAATAGPAFDIDVASFANHRRVQYYVDFFLGPARDRFTIWLGRMRRYEGMIWETLRKRGVPQDLVFLALIESGFSNSAVSRARAVGMWQFIASTAREYGLRIDAWVDERRDPFLATDAAARHLGDLNEQFGSWYLAAAAYNGGATRVSRGILRLRGDSASLSDTTFFALSDRRYLRRETRDYVPKLIAAAIIAKEPGRYGFSSITTHEPLAFDEISVTDATSLDVLADLADTTVRTLTELNPRFYRGVTPPGETVIVRVPRGTGPLVARRWADLPPQDRVSFVEHTIRRGETLGEIAKRYGVSLRLVVAANPGVNARRLRIGQRLTIPLSAAARRTAAVATAPVTRSSTGGRTHHTVHRGETLWGLARRYGVTVADLRRWNDITESEVLRAGTRLRVRG